MAFMLPGGVVTPSVPEYGGARTHRRAYQAQLQPPPPYPGLPGPDSDSETRRHPRIWGMSPLWFGIFIAAFTTLIVGSAVGGSAANSVKDAQKRVKQCTASSKSCYHTRTITEQVTTTRTFCHATANAAPFLDYVAAAPTAVHNTPLVCPDEDGKTYTTAHNEIFDLSCTSILAQGDVGCIVAYTFQDCIEACASLKVNQSSNVCTAITYNSNMAFAATAAPYYYGNCWLKQDVLARTAPNFDNNSISARLSNSSAAE
ncbi:hypothetical protein LTR17_016558 [Elasticomyces elasticus]|nr:hypothetical protein LTR17_016558 [Elasticomyces elasticus]